MKLLQQFLSLQSEPFPRPDSESYVAKYATGLGLEFMKTFGPKRESKYGFTFRSSAMGMHPYLLAYEYFHPECKNDDEFNPKTLFKFMTGYLLEAYMGMILERLGYRFSTQVEISWQVNDMTIGGHPDFFVESDEGNFILETKCVNSEKWNKWVSQGYVDDPKYQMQLAMYCNRLDTPGAFVAANVDTGELALLPIDYKFYEAKVIIGIANCNYVYNCKEWWETLENIKPPEPIKRKSGTYYPPPYMYIRKGVLHPGCCVYDYKFDDEGKVHISGYNYPELAKQWEPKL